MRIPVLVQRTKGNGYRAKGTEPFALSAKGATREEALTKLQEKIHNQIKKGAEVVDLEIGSQAHPWMAFAGMFKDDPLFDDWQKAIKDYRREVDEDPDYL